MTELMQADQSIHMVRVVNRNPFPIRDRYDGVPFEFLTNVPMSLPPDVAQHILGYPGDPEDMQRHMAKRWGWNLPFHMQQDERTGDMLWQRFARNIEVATEKFELRRIPDDPNAPIPADMGDIDPAPPADRLPDPRHSRATRRGWTKGKPRKAQLGGEPQPTEA